MGCEATPQEKIQTLQKLCFGTGAKGPCGDDDGSSSVGACCLYDAAQALDLRLSFGWPVFSPGAVFNTSKCVATGLNHFLGERLERDVPASVALVVANSVGSQDDGFFGRLCRQLQCSIEQRLCE